MVIGSSPFVGGMERAVPIPGGPTRGATVPTISLPRRILDLYHGETLEQSAWHPNPVRTTISDSPAVVACQGFNEHGFVDGMVPEDIYPQRNLDVFAFDRYGASFEPMPQLMKQATCVSPWLPQRLHA